MHLGAHNNSYGAGPLALVQHNGAANVRAVMDWLYSNFPQPDSLAFIGCSNAAILAPALQAARAATHYGANTTIVVAGDAESLSWSESTMLSQMMFVDVFSALSQIPGLTLSFFRREDIFVDAIAQLHHLYPNVHFGYHLH